MKHVILGAAAMVVAGSLAASAQQPPSVEKQIAEAVQILPPDLRAGATVVTYDEATGARKVLRQGTNFIECQPRMADGLTRYYSRTLAPRRDSEAKPRAQKKTDEQIQNAEA